MDRDTIIKKIEQCHNLPSLPTVAMEVLAMVRSEEIDLREIASLVSNDPALSSKVLRTVNSPFYGLTKRVNTISHALVILGLESVKTLVLGFSLVSSLQKNALRGKVQLGYWRRSLYAGVAASVFSQKVELPEAEEAFLGALLQDIGIQTLIQVVGKEYQQTLEDLDVWGRNLMRLERERFGIDHCEAGMLLAEQWHLPPILAEAVQFHHHPRRLKKGNLRYRQVIRLSSLCAEVFMGDNAGRFVGRVIRYAERAFKLSQGDSNLALKQVSNDTRDLAELFEMSIGELTDYENILSEANATLQEMTLRTQVRARELKTRAETDPLTRIANRGKLNDEAASEFERARKFMRPLSIIFIDADRFKSINDTLGHAAGDDALKFIAEMLRKRVRPMDTVGRYGGEEFVMLLPEVPMPEAVRLAEDLRAGFEADPPTLANQTWPMTISVGVATFDGVGGPYRNAGHLIQAADKAAYAAKRAGRNTVRVFTPKPKAAKPDPA